MTENMREFLAAMNEYDNAWTKLVINAEKGLDTEREEMLLKMHRARLISKFKQVDSND